MTRIFAGEAVEHGVALRADLESIAGLADDGPGDFAGDGVFEPEALGAQVGPGGGDEGGDEKDGGGAPEPAEGGRSGCVHARTVWHSARPGASAGRGVT